MMPASSKASRSPRLNPCPAIGCSACAALPITAMRCAVVLRAISSVSGNVRRSPDVRESPVAAAEMRGERRQERRVAELLRPRRVRGLLRPHQCVVIALGQQRDRALRCESLVGDAVVRPLESNCADDGDLSIVVASTRNAGHRRRCAIRDHGDARAQRLVRMLGNVDQRRARACSSPRAPRRRIADRCAHGRVPRPERSAARDRRRRTRAPASHIRTRRGAAHRSRAPARRRSS